MALSQGNEILDTINKEVSACAGTSGCRNKNVERGSVFFYILLGVVLFAALSYTVATMLRGEGDSGAVQKAKLHAQEVVEYGTKAKISVQDMKLSGIDAADLSFLKSGDAGYTTAPHTNKVFHPEGGGLPVPNLSDVLVPETLTPVTGVYMTRMAIDNVGTSSDEVILSVRGVKQAVCQQINKELTGSTTIPSTGANNHNALFVTGGTDLTAGVCASCVGKIALCVSQTGPTIYTFYSVADPN